MLNSADPIANSQSPLITNKESNDKRNESATRTFFVNMESHNGLRGLCTLWIMLFHCLIYGSYGDYINLMGSTIMPIFFLLSGFSLTIIYGKRENLDKLNFYRNRFARIYPVCLLTIVFAFGLFWTDFGYIPKEDVQLSDMPLSVSLNVLLILQWGVGLPLTVYTINGPTWFVSVLWFQYLVFPFTLRIMKLLANKRLCVFILYIFSVIISTFIIIRTGSFVVATMNVISPGFCMFHAGCFLGQWAEQKATNRFEAQSTSIEEGVANESTTEDDIKKWARITDAWAFFFFFVVFASIILYGFGFKMFDAGFSLQIYGSPLMMALIVSMALDDGKSMFSKFCCLPFFQWVAKIGMSVYLVHEVFIRYFSAIVKTFNRDLVQLTPYTPMPGGSMPYWGILIIVPISLVVGVLLERFIETPCRKIIRSQH